jgi:acetyl esterase/lipase
MISPPWPSRLVLTFLACAAFGFPPLGRAQIRTVTQQPYPTGGNSVAVIWNVPYVSGGGPQQQLDLYVPTERKNEPLIVYVHGGGWEHGDKMGDSWNPDNLQLLWDGYAMASINYRLAGPAAIWPAQIQDCKAALRWLRAHAEQYGYDPNRIGVIGESAGGHLVAMLGATNGDKTFDVGENLNASSDVACVVDLFGVSDFTLPMPALVTNLKALFGGSPSERPELARSASPVHYVHAGQPPMLVVHGTADKLVPYLQAEVLVEAMEKAGAPFYFHTVVGGGHNPYFGLAYNAQEGDFNAGGGGVGLFEDRAVEPLIFAFFRHYLLEGRKEPFKGSNPPSPAAPSAVGQNGP